MERNSERSFCCGAGGARMWMEETIGERINLNRTTEAVGTGADQIAVGCPFCRVMLSDGLSALQDSGDAREEVEVLDVAQMLLASVKGEPATRQKKASAGAAAAAGGGTATLTRDDEATRAEPEAGRRHADRGHDHRDRRRRSGRQGQRRLLAVRPGRGRAGDGVSREVGARGGEGRGARLLGRLALRPRRRRACRGAAGRGRAGEPEAASDSQRTDLGSGGSLFDLGGDEPAETPVVEESRQAQPDTTHWGGGARACSGFDRADLGDPAGWVALRHLGSGRARSGCSDRAGSRTRALSRSRDRSDVRNPGRPARGRRAELRHPGGWVAVRHRRTGRARARLLRPSRQPHQSPRPKPRADRRRRPPRRAPASPRVGRCSTSRLPSRRPRRRGRSPSPGRPPSPRRHQRRSPASPTRPG